MNARRSTLQMFSQMVIPTVMIAALLACGTSKQPAPAIKVTFSPDFPPPTALATSTTAGIAAIVANDPNNAGVIFTCLPAGACGTFTPAQIASNVPTTYQAPAAIPQGGTVSVTATSVTDGTKSVSATITIN